MATTKGEGRVLLIGDQRLRLFSLYVEKDELSDAKFLEEKSTLLRTLESFRLANGFGRAISAPQIGVNKRMIALNLGDERGAWVMLNPEVFEKSPSEFTMWDDCMSAPWLVARVSRSTNIKLRWMNDKGEVHVLDCSEYGGRALSELLQHEIDHLNGILFIDRAIKGARDIVARQVYENNREEFDKEVDYTIQPTI